MTLPISAPRNNFRLDEGASRSVLVAGGIGVTPVWCMLQRLITIGRPVEVIYCARSRQQAAFRDVIEALVHDKSVPLIWHLDNEQGGRPPDLERLLADKGHDSHYYCCGPLPMLNAFEKACEALGYPHAHIERFAAPLREAPSRTESFVVQCTRSGKTVEVSTGKSILDSLIDAGLNPGYSCKEGVCGACETVVLSGEVEHYDAILTRSERESNQIMMICVSRCRRGPLHLDI